MTESADDLPRAPGRRLPRRRFLTATGGALVGGTLAASCRTPEPYVEAPSGVALPDRDGAPRAVGTAGAAAARNGGWEDVRRQFALTDEYVHLEAMLIASHPRPVREAIEAYREALDENPALYLQQNNRRLQNEARAAAAHYLGAEAGDIALTESTTMGIGLVYNGLRLRDGQELLTTGADYYVTHEALRVAAARSGARLRDITLFDDIRTVSADGIVDRIAEAIRPGTRVLALTWVHSSTGLKLPLAAIREAVDEANRGRDEDDHVLLCIDGVHGFGIEDVTMEDLGADFFMTGCHKWLFGPRGTGLIYGRRRAYARAQPIVPSFIDDGTWHAWLTGGKPAGDTDADRMMPGGFKAFEHQWALTRAFEFMEGIGQARVAQRTHALARQLKDGLAGMAHVTLVTPRSANLSAGIVSFDVAGMEPPVVVRRLRERGIVGSVAPYATSYARLTPSIRNTEEEIDRALREVRRLA